MKVFVPPKCSEGGTFSQSPLNHSELVFLDEGLGATGGVSYFAIFFL